MVIADAAQSRNTKTEILMATCPTIVNAVMDLVNEMGLLLLYHTISEPVVLSRLACKSQCCNSFNAGIVNMFDR